jgi:hypothetical protein
MKTLLLFVFFLSGCITPKQQVVSKNFAQLVTIEKIPLGSSMGEIKQILGKPDKVEIANDSQVYIYQVAIGKYTVPKIEIWFDKSGLAYIKTINLFDQTNDGMNVEEAKKYFSKANFKVENPPEWGKPHLYPTDKNLQDQNVGLSVRYNPIRNNEVQLISWSKPKFSPQMSDTK